MVYCVANDDTMNVCLTALNVPNDLNDAIEDVEPKPFACYNHVGPIHPEHLSNLMVVSPMVFHFSSKSFHPDRDVDGGGCNANCNANYIEDSVIR